MSTDSLENQDALGRVGMCAQLVSLLEEYCADEAMVTMIIKTMLSLLSNNAANVSQISTTQYFSLYLDLLQKNLKHQKIFKVLAMLLVAILKNGDRDQVLTHGNEARVFETMDTFLNEVNEQQSSIKETCVMFFAHFALNNPNFHSSSRHAGVILTCRNLIKSSPNASYIQAAEIIHRLEDDTPTTTTTPSSSSHEMSPTDKATTAAAALTISHQASKFRIKEKSQRKG
jgi:hypothetical protein